MSKDRIADDGPMVQGGRFAPWAEVDRVMTIAPDGTCAVTPRERAVTPRDGHLGGPDDAHYSQLAIQPIEVTEAWAPTWPAGIGYHLGEAIAAIARCGTKGQAVRDLEKASWLCARAAAVIRGDAGNPNDKRGRP